MRSHLDAGGCSDLESTTAAPPLPATTPPPPLRCRHCNATADATAAAPPTPWLTPLQCHWAEIGDGGVTAGCGVMEIERRRSCNSYSWSLSKPTYAASNTRVNFPPQHQLAGKPRIDPVVRGAVGCAPRDQHSQKVVCPQKAVHLV
jgi:hypothetical protein